MGPNSLPAIRGLQNLGGGLLHWNTEIDMLMPGLDLVKGMGGRKMCRPLRREVDGPLPQKVC